MTRTNRNYHHFSFILFCTQKIGSPRSGRFSSVCQCLARVQSFLRVTSHYHWVSNCSGIIFFFSGHSITICRLPTWVSGVSKKKVSVTAFKIHQIVADKTQVSQEDVTGQVVALRSCSRQKYIDLSAAVWQERDRFLSCTALFNYCAALYCLFFKYSAASVWQIYPHSAVRLVFSQKSDFHLHLEPVNDCRQPSCRM